MERVSNSSRRNRSKNIRSGSVFRLALAASVGLGSLALAAPVARAATRTWTGGGTDASWLTTANWGGTAPVTGDALVFDGLGLTTTNNLAAASSINGITFNTSAGGFALNGNSVTLGGDITVNSLAAQSIGLQVALGVTPTINVASRFGSLTMSGLISGAFGITKTGNGLLSLSTATNTLVGPVTVTGGTLSVDNDLRLGTAPLSATAGQIVLNGGALRVSASNAINANRGIALGGIGAGGKIDITNGQTVTYNGILANNGGTNSFTKTGSGLLALGGPNTYTGNTLIDQGTLKLDFTQGTAPASDIINAASAVVMGGVNTSIGNSNAPATGQTNNVGTYTVSNPSGGNILNVTSKSASNSAQTFAGMTLNAGFNTISTVQTGGGNVLLNVGAITRNSGGLASFNLAGTMGAANAIRTSTSNTNGILGGWASYNGTDFAANDGSGNVVACTGYTPMASGAIANAPAANVRFTNTGTTAFTLSGTPTAVNINTLSQNSIGASTVNLAAGDTLRLGATGGVLVGSTAVGTGGITIGQTVSQGRLTAGDSGQTTGGEITFLNYGTKNPPILVNAVIANNNASTGAANSTGGNAVSVTIGGTMGNGTTLTTLAGTNTYSGGTTIASGRVGVGTTASFGTGPVTVLNGAQAFLSPAGIYTNSFNLSGAGTTNNSNGFDTPGALRIGTSGTTISGAITLLNDASINSRNTSNNLLSGQIGGAFNLTLTGNGAGGGNIALTNSTNNWTGNLIIDQKIVFTGVANTGNVSVIPSGAGNGNVILANTANSILDLNGNNQQINGLLSLGTAPFVQNSGTQAATLTVGAADATSSFTGIIRNGTTALGITKVGSGVLGLTNTNTYSGNTTVNAGVVQVTGSIGASSVLVNATATSAGELRGAGNGSSTGLVGALTLGANNGANIAHINPGTGPRGGGSIGTLTMSALTVNGGDLAFDLTPSTTLDDLIIVNGAVNFSAPSTVTLSGTLASGTNTYTLITSTSAITYGTLPTLVQQTTGRPATITPDTTSNPNQFRLTVVSGAANLTWTGLVNSNWNNNIDSNWTDGSSPQTFFTADNVTFADGPANTAVNLVGTLVPGSVTVNNSAADYTFSGSGSISGVSSLTKTGTAGLIISNVNSYSGTTLISAGAVQVNDGGSLGTSAVTNNSVLRFNNAVAATHANVISGTGQLQKIGVGATTLSGANTYSGSTEIYQGALSITGSLSGSGAVNVNTSASSAGELRGSGVVGNVTLQPDNGSNIAAVSPGAGGINSIGTLTASSFTANGGNLIFDLATPATTGDLFAVNGPVNFAAASTITLNPTTPPQTGTITLLSSSGNIVYDVTPTLVPLAGTYRPANYTLNTASDPNKLQVDVVSGAFSLFWTGTAGNNWDVNNTINWQDGAATPQKYFDGDQVTFNSIATNHTVNLITALTPGSVVVDTTSGDYTFGGAGSIAGGASLTKNGAGTLLTSNANTYSGGTIINAGSLQLDNGGGIGSGPVTADGNLVVNNTTTPLAIINPISGAGQVIKQNIGTLVLNGNNTYSGGTTLSGGVLQVGTTVAQAGTNTAAGSGTLTLSGGLLQSYTDVGGAPVDTPGYVVSNPIVVTAATTTTLSGFSANGGIINLVLSGSIAGSGTIKSDPVYSTVNSSVVFYGDLSNFTGTIDYTNSAGNGSNFIFGDNTGAFAGFPANLTINASQAKVFVHGAGTSKRLTVNGFIAGGFLMGELSGDGLVQGSSGGLTNFDVGFLNSNSTFAGVIANGGGTGGGAASLTKDGTGTFVLSGANTFTGDTAVNGGILNLANAQAIQSSTLTTGGTTFDSSVASHAFTFGGLRGSFNLVLADNAITPNPVFLTIGNNNQSNTYSGVLSGAGALTKIGTGTQTLGGTNTYTGGTTLNAGITAISAEANLGAAAGLLTINGATLNVTTGLTTARPTVFGGAAVVQIEAGQTFVQTSAITGAGSLNKTGTGTLEVSALNNYGGNTTVTAGTMTISAGGAIASPTVTVAVAGTLNVNGALASTATVNANGVTNFAGSTGGSVLNRPLTALNVGNGVTVTVTPSAFPFTPAILQPATLTFANATAKLDLTNNELIVNEALGTAVGRIISGQIFSSSIVAGSALGSLSLSPTQSEVRFTLQGDTNLDAKVEVGDLGNLATNYGTTSGATWVQGDTNYDGNVDVGDLGNLATNYGNQLAASPSARYDGSELLASSLATVAGAGSAAVPEPASIGLLALGAMALLPRRRRR